MRRSIASVALAAATVASTPLFAQESTDADWVRVTRLRPGQAITVTTRNGQPVDRYVLSADQSRITLLNVTDPALPDRVADSLRKIASEHPEYFDQAARSGTLLFDKVRMSSAGIFLDNAKVAELQRVVEIIAAAEVDEITMLRKGRGFWGHLGPIGGYFVGALAGGFVGGAACQAAAGQSRCDTGGFMVGMVIGGVAGTLYGYGAANRETEEVIYLRSDRLAR